MIDPHAIPPATGGAGKLLPPGAGATLHLLGDVATTKVAANDTAGGLSVVELATPVGGGVAEHVHSASDETIYVLDGTFDVRVGGNRAVLGAGGCAFVARGMVHDFTNVGETPGRVLLISSPATHAQRVWMEMAAGLGRPQG